MFGKNKQSRCKKYLNWVKSLNSSLSCNLADDAHHCINVLPAGMGAKPHDFFTFPLTRGEHIELHHKGAKQWEKDNNINQAEEALKILDMALSQGLIEIKWVGE